MPRSRRGFTWVELIVTILVLLLFVLLISPALLYQRDGPRCRTQCMNNIRQLGLALINFDSVNNRLPNSGTWASELDVTGTPTGGASYPGGPDDPEVNDIRWDYPLKCWVVDILPFLERSDIADAWKRTELKNDGTNTLALFDEPDRSGGTPVWDKKGMITHYTLSQTYLALLVCTDDDSIQGGKGNLSYVVNGGPVLLWQHPMSNGAKPAYLQFSNGAADPDDDTYKAADDLQAAKNLGLLYPGSLKGNTPWDTRRSLSKVPDGTSTTIMLGENIRSGYDPAASTAWYDVLHPGQPGVGQAESSWANPDPNYSTFRISDDFCDTAGKCQGGPTVTLHLKDSAGGTSTIAVRRPDWSKANSRDSRDNMRGDPESINGAFATEEGWPYLSSYHPGGVNVVMCDGSTRFLSQDIDGDVLAKLMSPAGTRAMRQTWAVYQEPIGEESF